MLDRLWHCFINFLIWIGLMPDKKYPGTNGPSGNGPDREFTSPGQDIYTSWALGAGRRDFFPDPAQQEWFTVLLELKGISALAFAQGEDANGTPLIDVDDFRNTWLASVVVPPLYLREGDGVKDKLYLTSFVREDFFREFLERDFGARLRSVVSAVRMGTPPSADPLSSRILQEDQLVVPSPPVWPDLTGNTPSDGVVVIGIIDDGIAFGHERFWKDEARTRIEAVWLQDRKFNDGVGLQGREFTRSQIDVALASATHGGLIDEDSFYRDLGAVNFGNDTPKSVAKRLSHGAHIMDAACGLDYRDAGERALAADRPIVAVQLPTDSTADTSGTNLEPYLDAAVYYILYRAHLIAAERGTGPIPVVINFSYGHHLGAHDGSSISENAIEHRIADRMMTEGVPLRVVVPSGNSHLSRTHALIDFDDGTTTKELLWQIQPDGKTWSFMEVWMPSGSGSSSRLALTVTSPGGQSTALVGEGGARQTLPPSPTSPEEEFCIVEYDVDVSSGRSVFGIKIAPTERLAPHDDAIAPSGRWTVALTKQALPDGEKIHAWIQRDGPPLGFPIRGRQSYFDHECYQRYDEYGRPIEIDDPICDIRREGTISGLATTDGEMIVVGGYIRKEDRPSPYSAGGPTNAARVGPDAMAVSNDSAMHRGLLAAGTRSGSTEALDGTSVAAPQITRWISERVSGTSLPSRSDVQTYAVGFSGQPVPDPRRGHGKIEMPAIVRRERFED